MRGKLAAGGAFSVAVDADGSVWSWGYNTSGELGDGTQEARLAPVRVPNLSEFEAVASGLMHTVALRRDGTVWGWGQNWYGQLGTGEAWVRQPTPRQIPGLTGVTAIAASEYHSLALRQDGTVWGFGENYSGQLGENLGFILQPTPIQGLTNVVAIATADRHSLALRSDGTVWAWGENTYSQLGDGTQVSRPTPARVEGLPDIVAIAAGGFGGSFGHSLALGRDGSVWAWGYNATGQLGDGTNQTRSTPVRVQGLKDVAALAASPGLSLALHRDGTVSAWGDGTSGQLGNGATVGFLNTPGRVQDLESVVAISAGMNHALALRRDGTLWGWGSNSNGQLATGTNLRTTPVSVKNLGSVVSASVGMQHALAVQRDGSAWAWGNNTYGQLGDGTTQGRTEPIRVPGVSDAVAVATGGSGSSFAVRADGTLWSWGDNSSGQLGDGTKLRRSTPLPVPGLDSITSVVASNSGDSYVLALRADGTVWTWGSNYYGQLGDGTRNGGRRTPAQVQGLSDIVAIKVGASSSFALRADGTLWGWGDNQFGQLGDGTRTARLTPVQVQGLSDVVAFAAGNYHVLALRSDGTVWAWGWNWDGQLGNGHFHDEADYFRTAPSPVPGLTAVSSIEADGYFSLALRSDGSVWAWGDNTYGQLGDGTVQSRATPAQVSGVRGQAVGLAAGPFVSMAVLADGTLRSWGSNGVSLIGDGVSAVHAVPARVRLPCRFTGMPSAEHRASSPECHAAP